MDAAAERKPILQNDPAYFYCDRTHAWLKKTACVDRHTNGLHAFLGTKRRVPEECKNCEQGALIAQEVEEMDKPDTERQTVASSSLPDQSPAFDELASAVNKKNRVSKFRGGTTTYRDAR